MTTPQPIQKKGSIDPEEWKRLRLEKQEKKKAAKKLLNSKPQVVQEPPPKVLERSFADVPNPKQIKEKNGHIRVMDFNLLAQGLVKRHLFPDSGNLLRWKCRRKMLIDEIQLYNPDILTMQEMDNYESFYKDELSNLGYTTKYYKHKAKVHGCCIAFKKDKFSSIECITIDYNTDDLCPPSYLTGNIGQVIVLEYYTSPGVRFIVGNTHLYWKPSANYERFRQSIIFSNRLLELKARLVKESAGQKIKWVSLLIGDFNTTPDEAGYPLFVENKLSKIHLDDIKESLDLTIKNHNNPTKDTVDGGDDEDKTDSLDNLTIESLNSVDLLLKKYTPGHWQSVYSYFGQINTNKEEQDFCGEPKFTNYTVAFKGTLDYMFIEKDADISVKRILMMPKEEDLKPSLPNKNFGSDHLCLIAEIEF